MAIKIYLLIMIYMVFVVVVVVGNQEQNAMHFRVLTNAVDGM